MNDEAKSERVEKCPKCGDTLKRIYSKRKEKHYWVCENAEELCGAFYGDQDGKPVPLPSRGEPDNNVQCPECGAAMRRVSNGAHGDFWSCSGYPECKGSIDIQRDGSLAPLCPEDSEHGHMRKRTGKNGQFWSCRAYPECNATLEINGRKKREPKK